MTRGGQHRAVTLRQAVFMTVFVSFTCGRADAVRLRDLLDRLAPALARHRGALLPMQGPNTGFFDPSFGELVVMRLVGFPSAAHAEALLRDPVYLSCAAERARFARLDVAIVDRE